MKRSRPKRPMSALDYSDFARGVFALHGDGCWACRTDTANRWKCLDRSNGLVDWHHILPQRLLKAELHPDVLMDALRDGRNGVCLHRWHHDQCEASFFHIEIPDPAWRFADDYGLTLALEKYEERAA